MVNKLSGVIDNLGLVMGSQTEAMEKQTGALSGMGKNIAVHSEVIRGLSIDINELKLVQYPRPRPPHSIIKGKA